jgi:hypothetical protein
VAIEALQRPPLVHQMQGRLILAGGTEIPELELLSGLVPGGGEELIGPGGG